MWIEAADAAVCRGLGGTESEIGPVVEPAPTLGLDDAVNLVCEQLDAVALAVQTRRALIKVWARFARFGIRSGVRCIADVDAGLVERFVHASADGLAPSVAAMHWRRSALRMLFRLWRSRGLVDRDPTLDLALPPRSLLATRALSDDEVELCRWVSLDPPTETVFAAVWALAEAGASSGEIPHVLVRDVRVAEHWVRLSGSTKAEARNALLTQWSSKQLARRAATLDHDLSACVAYPGRGTVESGQAWVSGTISKILHRAGLADDAQVRPRSITAWVGRRIFDETRSIDIVAQRLGLRSLDRAAALIGWDWRMP